MVFEPLKEPSEVITILQSESLILVAKAAAEKPEKEALQWIVDNASVYTKREIRHASQGFVLTLMPLALYWMLNQKNNFLLGTILKQGRETEKLGALAGAWSGAVYGEQVIPKNLKTGLVNSREIRLRGEALFQRRMKKDIKRLSDMEMALTAKEPEEAKRYQPKEPKTCGRIILSYRRNANSQPDYFNSLSL